MSMANGLKILSKKGVEGVSPTKLTASSPKAVAVTN